MALLSSIAGGTSRGLIMPEVVSGLYIKTNDTTFSTSGVTSFWTAVDESKTPFGWESVSLTATADTTEQTIVDFSGAGVLTHIIPAELSASGTMTVRVTADGTLTTFVSNTITDTIRYLIGSFPLFSATGTAGDGAGIGSAQDAGYVTASTPRALLTTSPQAIQEGGVGIVFNTSLKVTIQGSVNISASSFRGNAAVCYTNYIPEGL